MHLAEITLRKHPVFPHTVSVGSLAYPIHEIGSVRSGREAQGLDETILACGMEGAAETMRKTTIRLAAGRSLALKAAAWVSNT